LFANGGLEKNNTLKRVFFFFESEIMSVRNVLLYPAETNRLLFLFLFVSMLGSFQNLPTHHPPLNPFLFTITAGWLPIPPPISGTMASVPVPVPCLSLSLSLPVAVPVPVFVPVLVYCKVSSALPNSSPIVLHLPMVSGGYCLNRRSSRA
jgi:hypothetical protein